MLGFIWAPGRQRQKLRFRKTSQILAAQTHNMLKILITAVQLQSQMMETQGERLARVEEAQIRRSVEDLFYVLFHDEKIFI
jgi:hypothetical protein